MVQRLAILNQYRSLFQERYAFGINITVFLGGGGRFVQDKLGKCLTGFQ